MNISMRPGIYTEYTLTPVFAQSGGKAIGIAATSKLIPEGVQKITSLSQAIRVFGPIGNDNVMMQLIHCIYSITTPVIYAAAVSEDTDTAYQQALDTLFSGDAYLILCGRKSSSCYGYIKSKLSDRTEKLAVVGEIPTVDPIETARELNSERICLTAPVVTETNSQTDLAPAILASFISQSNDPTGNLNGESISGDYQVSESYTEQKTEQLLTNGICVLEQNSGLIELIRGMTTRTLDSFGHADYTYRNLSVIRILDTVIPSLRETLKGKLDSSRGDRSGLNSILSLTVCKLDEFLDAGLLSSYEMPMVSLDKTDRSVCIVEVGFVIAQGINSIYLTAHISV